MLKSFCVNMQNKYAGTHVYIIIIVAVGQARNAGVLFNAFTVLFSQNTKLQY